MVKHSPCSSYKELNSILKLSNLVLNWHTSVNCDHIELLLIVSELLELCRDLEGKLSGWSQDDGSKESDF